MWGATYPFACCFFLAGTMPEKLPAKLQTTSSIKR